MNDESENKCLIVCSRGIVKMCERHNNFLSSSTRQIDDEIFINLKDYTVVHLCSWLSISIFATKYAPNIKNKIILVTNDSDFDAPVFDKPVGKGDEINKEGILNFLNSEYCVYTKLHTKTSKSNTDTNRHGLSHIFKTNLPGYTRTNIITN